MFQEAEFEEGSVPVLDEASGDADFSFAFQPIIDLERLTVVGQEALVRGAFGESAETIMNSIQGEGRQLFDQACQQRALDIAGRLGIDVSLHLNCSSVTPDNFDATLASIVDAAQESGVDPDRVVLEFARLEPLGTPRELDEIRRKAHQAGLQVLADNFGATEVALKRLVVFQPDWLKLDRNLVQRIHCSDRRQALVHGVLATCRMLGIDVVATGVEETDELDWLRGAGVRYFQGYLFSRPAFETLPKFDPARLDPA